MTRTPVPAAVLLPLIWLVGEQGSSAQTPGAGARLTGVVRTLTGEGLPGVAVTLTGETPPRFQVVVSGAGGAYAFENLEAGTYRLLWTHSGYEDLEQSLVLAADGQIELDVTLQLAPFSETVRIEGSTSVAESNQPEEAVEFKIEDLSYLPLASERFQEALPLVPGVVRDPDGRLSFNGARPSQSSLLVNGANVTDPVTGEFAIEIPIKAIEAVEVHTLPYSAEFGNVTAAVADVKTRGGTDEWDIDFDNLWPSFNWRDGTIKGIRSAVPLVQVSGPLKKGHAWISQGFAVRFVRSRVRDVEIGSDERILESFDTFTQLDFKISDRHDVTTTFSYFPVETDNYGLSALLPENATPDFNSWGWNAAVSTRSFFSRTLVETNVAVKSYDVAIRPKSEDGSLLTPEGLRNNYFNEINRETLRWQAGASCSHALPDLFGEHVLKFGGRLAHTDFTGSDRGLPVEIRGAEGQPLRRIEFLGPGSIAASDLVVSAYVQDKWRVSPRVGIDVGARFDYDRLVGEHQIAPRLSVAVALDDDGLTVAKAGVGVFYDHVFLHSGSFTDFQERQETELGADGLPAAAPVRFENRLSGAGLDNPRSLAWNLELDRELRPGWLFRINYRERRGSQEMIVDRLQTEQEAALVLSSTGESVSKELDVTMKMSRGEESELYFSYVKSRVTGDLNNFGELYQNLRAPILLESEDSLLAFDVPHRFLMWGVLYLPWDLILSPGVEWRSGFPYTVFDEGYAPVGERNRGGRFPNFLSVDFRVTKGVKILGREGRVGVQVFNLGSHSNPRDVVDNLASPRFGEFLNSVDMGVSLRLQFGL